LPKDFAAAPRNVANEYAIRFELFERLERILMHGVHHV
jgi:hypothetical protein